MKKFCTTLAVILLICGIICGIIVTNKLGIISAILVFMSGIVLPIILFAIGEALQKLDDIKKTLEAVSPGLESLSKEAKNKEILEQGGWKCPDCGTINRFYVTDCKCGKAKPE